MKNKRSKPFNHLREDIMKATFGIFASIVVFVFAMIVGIVRYSYIAGYAMIMGMVGMSATSTTILGITFFTAFSLMMTKVLLWLGILLTVVLGVVWGLLFMREIARRASLEVTK